MAPNEEGGNLQTFNFQYFGFYPGYVTLHSKANKYQAVIIGSNFNTNTIPTVSYRGYLLDFSYSNVRLPGSDPQKFYLLATGRIFLF